MITLTARIKLIAGNEIQAINDSKIRYGNLSSSINNVTNKKVSAQHPFLVNASKLNDGSVLMDSVNGFIGMSDNSYSNMSLAIYTATELSNITIVFNPYFKHPAFTVDGIYHTDDDNIYTISLVPNLSHFIRFEDSYQEAGDDLLPIYIEGIYTDITIKIDATNLLGITDTTYERADLSLPSYGIISNSGMIRFNDLDGEIGDYIEARLLKKGVDVEIYLTDTLTKKSDMVGKKVTSKWDYNNNTREVSVTIKDRLEEWQDISVDGINYDPRQPDAWAMEQYYQYLYERTPAKYNMLPLSELDDATINALQVLVPYPVLDTASLWAQWNKLCVAARCHIYDDNGTTVFKYNGGN
jgi:hypothetical protein